MNVFIDVHDKRWNKYKIDFKKIVNAVVGKKYKNAEVSIVLTNDNEIRDINKQYRNVDKATNVLSFELGDDLLLGDIFISFDTVAGEAKKENILFENHVTHMVVHGMFHLLGYDHITDDDAAIMELKEVRVLKKLGIKNPYEASDEFNCTDGSCCPGSKMIAWLKSINVQENSVWQYALYAVFGGIAGFGFAPFYQWWWTILGIAGAYWLTVRNKSTVGVFKTLVQVAPFGAMYAIAMFWWVLNSIYVVPEIAEQYAIWTIPGVIGLMLAGVGIFSWPFVAVARIKTSAASRVFLFAGVWTFVLWAREWAFTGFPWNPIANITMPMPMLANSMSLWGALGLTFIIVGIIAAIVEVFFNKKSAVSWVVFCFFGILLGTGCVIGYCNMKRADDGAGANNKTVRIVQPGASQSKKATHNRADALQYAEDNLVNLVSLARAPGNADLVVFPETSYPFVVVDNDDIAVARILNKPVILGANTFGNGGLFNSMVIADINGNIKHVYSKSHLVPFGEYSPMGILPSPANLTPGNGPELINVDGFVFAPAVCYEIIFSNSLLPENVKNVNAIINITNDNWFGNTPGTYQHLDMVRRYAIESGLPIIRANYSGISAFVASDGSVVSSLPVGVAGVLDGFVWGEHKTLYRALGMNVWFIIVLLVAVMGAVGFRKK